MRKTMKMTIKIIENGRDKNKKKDVIRPKVTIIQTRIEIEMKEGMINIDEGLDHLHHIVEIEDAINKGDVEVFKDITIIGAEEDTIKVHLHRIIIKEVEEEVMNNHMAMVVHKDLQEEDTILIKVIIIIMIKAKVGIKEAEEDMIKAGMMVEGAEEGVVVEEDMANHHHSVITQAVL